jgi:hypothetical protein
MGLMSVIIWNSQSVLYYNYFIKIKQRISQKIRGCSYLGKSIIFH